MKGTDCELFSINLYMRILLVKIIIKTPLPPGVVLFGIITTTMMSSRTMFAQEADLHLQIVRRVGKG